MNSETKRPEVTFQALLKALGEKYFAQVQISNIEERDNILYFKINGHQYQTYGNHINHEGSFMYDSPPTKIFAEQENTPEGVERSIKINEQVNTELDQWIKYGDEITLRTTMRCIANFLMHSDTKKFIRELTAELDIFPGDGAKEFMKKLAKNDPTKE